MKTFFKVVTLAVVMASSSVANAVPQIQKLAVVFPSKIMQQSPKLEQIKKKLSEEFKARIEALKKMEKEINKIEEKLKRDSALMADSDVITLQRKMEVELSEYKLKRKAFEEDKRRRQREEQQKAFIQISEVIDAVAIKEGFDIVLNGEQIVFSKPELDISDIVIKEISKK